MGAQAIIFLAIVNLSLFVAAAVTTLLAQAFAGLARRQDKTSWRVLASATRRLGQALTLLLIVAVLATALAWMAALLLSSRST